MEKIFYYDNTIEGFFSCIFVIYDSKAQVNNITSDNQISVSFDKTLVQVETNETQYRRVKAGIMKHIGERGINSVYLAYSSCNEKKELIIYKYLKLAFIYGAKVYQMLADNDVITYNEMVSRVAFECHRFNGFVRFRQTTTNIYIAPIRPDNDIVEHIMPHFTSRFGTQKFAIVDVKRNKVGYFDGDNIEIGTYGGMRDIQLTDDEIEFQQLWKQYYETVTIADRKSERRRKQFMPTRYWEFMPEINMDKQAKKSKNTSIEQETTDDKLLN